MLAPESGGAQRGRENLGVLRAYMTHDNLEVT